MSSIFDDEEFVNLSVCKTYDDYTSFRIAVNEETDKLLTIHKSSELTTVNQDIQSQMILKAISPLQLAYSKQLTEKQLDFYVKMLSDFPAQFVSNVTIKWIKKEKFLPTIAELRSCVIDLAHSIALQKVEKAFDERNKRQEKAREEAEKRRKDEEDRLYD